MSCGRVDCVSMGIRSVRFGGGLCGMDNSRDRRPEWAGGV